MFNSGLTASWKDMDSHWYGWLDASFFRHLANEKVDHPASLSRKGNPPAQIRNQVKRTTTQESNDASSPASRPVPSSRKEESTWQPGGANLSVETLHHGMRHNSHNLSCAKLQMDSAYSSSEGDAWNGDWTRRHLEQPRNKLAGQRDFHGLAIKFNEERDTVEALQVPSLYPMANLPDRRKTGISPDFTRRSTKLKGEAHSGTERGKKTAWLLLGPNRKRKNARRPSKVNQKEEKAERGSSPKEKTNDVQEAKSLDALSKIAMDACEEDEEICSGEGDADRINALEGGDRGGTCDSLDTSACAHSRLRRLELQDRPE
ncbi:hypothetical protein BKA70DRAFT_1218137 [Coprinopsis sp. MPI-PUGE-AT-0042]|nr:hypothetical protein BKA70DRAFT_1218137 [Coprinopsis sp. MPI-PUGE-AT-0042]